MEHRLRPPVLALGLAMLLLTACVAPAVAAEPWVDAAPSTWAETELREAAALRFVPGDVWNAPQSPITREQFARLAMGFLALQYNYDNAAFERRLMYGYLTYGARYGAPPAPFTDAASSTVAWAWALGVVEGRGEGLFDPEGLITRQEAAVMLARAYKVYAGATELPETPEYADAGDIAPWAADAVALVSSLGVMRGVGDERFDPLGAYTCEQGVMTFLRLWRDAPVSRAKGTVTPLMTYEEELAFIEAHARSQIFAVQKIYEGPLCDVIYGEVTGVMRADSDFFLLYHSGGTGRLWTDAEARPAWNRAYLDFSLSKDGTKLYYGMEHSIFDGPIVDWYYVYYEADLITGETVETRVETREEHAARTVIADFFALYAQGKHDDMKELSTAGFWASFLSDLPSTGVFGMKTARLTECIYVEEDSDENRMVFICTFDMTRMEGSVYEQTQTTATFFVDVQRVDDTWKLSGFHTG